MINVNVAKAEKIYWMVYAEIKAYEIGAKDYKNGESASESYFH